MHFPVTRSDSPELFEALEKLEAAIETAKNNVPDIPEDAVEHNKYLGDLLSAAYLIEHCMVPGEEE